MTAPRRLGRTLHGLPAQWRSVVPRAIRESVRQRIGPFAPWEAGFAHEPPAPEPGLVAAPPDFVGIGVQKAGTTWWYEMLCAHAGVWRHPGLHKERHFFARFATEPFGAGDVDAYRRSFPRPPGMLAGEWTPDYLFQPWTARLLHEAAPDARLLVLVRDPVERLRSGVAHRFAAPGSHPGSVLSEAVARGFYAAGLETWTARFGAERLLVLQYERCVADPHGELARTWRFLGLDPGPSPPGLERPVSATEGEKAPLAEDARRRLVELYAPDVERLMAGFPDLDVGLWPNFAPE